VILTRVAVAPGTAFVRVAATELGDEPRVLAELAAIPGRGPAPTPAAALAAVVGEPPEELVLVHPMSWPPARVAAFARGATRVRTVAGPVAAFAGPGARVVLDVGHSGAEATLMLDGIVVLHRRCGIGGARLDDAVSALLERRGAPPVAGPDRVARWVEARRVREELSLRATAVAQLTGTPVRIDAGDLREVLTPLLRQVVALLRRVLDAAPGRTAAVLLIGGVARTPLLAELVDAEMVGAEMVGAETVGAETVGADVSAGTGGVTVAPRPDVAAVLGALGAIGRGPVGTGTGVAARPTEFRRILPPLPARPRRPFRVALCSVGAIGATAGLLGVGNILVPPRAAVAVPAVVAGGVLVQYGYRLDVPEGWEHSGGLPERRRSLLTPAAAPEGSDLIAVERTPLGYDAGAEPERARAELRAEFDGAVAGGAALSHFDPDLRVAGREVTSYLQTDGAGVVEWFVVLDGDSQLSVGCRHTRSGVLAVRAACAVAVASVRRT